jgi:hypothetical protein
MKYEFKITDEAGNVQQCAGMRSYLSKFVDPKRYYDVPYTIKQDGTRVNEPSYLIGADLTENQIAILFSEMLL